MLHIDNLCQFVKLLIDNKESGIFFPQNGEYTNTSEMVKMIAAVKGHSIIMIPWMSLLIKSIEKIPGKIGSLATKAFGDLVYDMKMSDYKEEYRVNNLRRSIELSEGKWYRNQTPQMRTEFETHHILTPKAFKLARPICFQVEEIKYWHLFAIPAAFL